MKTDFINKISKYLRINKTIGLALGGGASKGMAIFAIIEGLEKKKIKIDMISGTSVGAIIAAYYALFGEVESLKKTLLNFSTKEWKEFIDLNITSNASLIKAKRYDDFLKDIFKNKTFEDTNVPLFIVATDLTRGNIKVFNSGKILDAVLASSAFPGIFPARVIDKNVYVDGGIINNLPYDILLEQKANKVIAVNLNDTKTKQKINPKSGFNVLNNSFDLMMDNTFKKINPEITNLFIFEPQFKKSFSNKWKLNNLLEKYKIGIKEFESKSEEFNEWLSN